MPSLTVGLTGGLAAGKSAVAAAFRDLGVPVCDADQVARDIVAPGCPALKDIAANFGVEVLNADGSLDRAQLRARVFGNAPLRQQLEAITHPHIRAELLRWREKQSAPYCIFEVSILIESGMDQLVDRILVVDCLESEQIQRAILRDGIDPKLAQAILDAQASRSDRLARAHDVIENHGSRSELQAAVAALHPRYLRWAQTPAAGSLP